MLRALLLFAHDPERVKRIKDFLVEKLVANVQLLAAATANQNAGLVKLVGRLGVMDTGVEISLEDDSIDLGIMLRFLGFRRSRHAAPNVGDDCGHMALFTVFSGKAFQRFFQTLASVLTVHLGTKLHVLFVIVRSQIDRISHWYCVFKKY